MKKNILLLTLSIIICLLLAEFLLRLFANDIIPFSVPDWDLGYIYRRNFQTTRYSIESRKEVTISTNQYGIRDRPWQMDKDALKIMIIGDSFVEAFHIERDQRFTKFLEDKLLKYHKSVQVFNLGKGGCGPENYLEYLKKFYPIIKPDRVIVCIYNGNDFEDLNYRVTPKSGRMNYIVLDGEVIRYREVAPRKERIIWHLKVFLGRFFLTQMIYKMFLQIKHSDPHDKSGKNPVPDEQADCPFCCRVRDKDRIDSFTIMSFILKRMKAITGKRLLILQIPMKNQMDVGKSRDCDNMLPENYMNKICHESGLELIQLMPLMGKEIKQYYWSHLNYRGHMFVAEAIYNRLKK